MIFGGVFSELRDARRAQGKRYALEPLLCAIVMSLMAGANSFRTIEIFIAERLTELNGLFGTSWVGSSRHDHARSAACSRACGVCAVPRKACTSFQPAPSHPQLPTDVPGPNKQSDH